MLQTLSATTLYVNLGQGYIVSGLVLLNYVKLRAWEKTASKLASAQAAREKRVVAEAKLSHRRAAAERAPAAVLLLSHTDVLQPVRRAHT